MDGFVGYKNLICRSKRWRFYGGETIDVLVGDAEGGEANLLRELGELGVGEEGDVAEELVANVGLGRVERLAGVADVLRRMEDPEGQSGQEIPRG